MSLPVKLDDNYLESLPGLGPAFKKKLFSIGIKRISDLILFLPAFLIDKTKYPGLLTFFLGSLFGVIDEIYQSTVFGRSPSSFDVIADVIGLTLSIILVQKTSDIISR